MSVAPRAGPAPQNRCPGPNRGPGLRARDVGYGNVTGARHPDLRGKYVALGAQDLTGFRSDPRAGAARREPYFFGY